MQKKFSLISNIVEDAISPKIKYQLFEADVGFEHAELLIPFDRVDDFIEAASNANPKGITALSKIVAEFGGSVK
jgi:hypothetical protein